MTMGRCSIDYTNYFPEAESNLVESAVYALNNLDSCLEHSAFDDYEQDECFELLEDIIEHSDILSVQETIAAENFVDACCEYIEHHGIKGQVHGVRNGPPYPLNPSARSASEKRLASAKENYKTAKKQYRKAKKAANKANKKLGNHMSVGEGTGTVYAARGKRRDKKKNVKALNKAMEAQRNLANAEQHKADAKAEFKDAKKEIKLDDKAIKKLLKETKLKEKQQNKQ